MKSFSATCAFCEYFDGGGSARVARARSGERISGDCLGSGDRFEPTSEHTCGSWSLCSTLAQDKRVSPRFLRSRPMEGAGGE